MPSTYSNSLRIELIGKGEQAGTWDETTNENLGTLLEAAIAGHVEIALADANYSLTANNGSDDEARHASIKFTGTLTATRTITLPSLKSKMYIFENATNQSLVFDAGGTTRTVVAGDRVLAYVDNSGNVADQITSLAALKITSADIDGGTIDNTPIGGATPAAGAFTTLSSTGNTTLGGAAGNVLIGTTNQISSSKVTLDNGSSASPIVAYNSSNANGSYVGFFNSSAPRGYIGSAAALAGGSAGDFTLRAEVNQIFAISGTEAARITSSGAFKWCPTNSSINNKIAGLGAVYTLNTVNFIGTENAEQCLIVGSNNTGASGVNTYFNAGFTGNHFASFVNNSAVYRVESGGDVKNTNNSYGAISDRKLKNLLQQKYGADYYERFKQIQFWTYTLINDPTNQKMLGVVAQELQDIFPGLVESTPDMHEVKKSRAVIKKIQRTRTEQQSKTNRTIEEVDGRWTLIEETETVDVEVPMFEEHQVFDQNGNPVMQLVKAGVPEVLDADGKVLQPAVEPVYLPVIHRVPVIDEIEEQQEYTESVQKINPETGDPEVTLSVKYSILYQIAAMVIQELQFRNDEHTLIISDQTKEIALLTARIEALENK